MLFVSFLVEFDVFFDSNTNEYDPYSSLIHFGTMVFLPFFVFLRDDIFNCTDFLNVKKWLEQISLCQNQSKSKCALTCLNTRTSIAPFEHIKDTYTCGTKGGKCQQYTGRCKIRLLCCHTIYNSASNRAW